MSPAELTALLRAEIPLADFMGVQVTELSEREIRLHAPFAPNRNIHGSGFAGSLYTLSVLSGWTLLTSLLQRRGLKGAVVASRAEIRYLQPVLGDLHSHCALPAPAEVELFLQRLLSKGKARLQLGVSLGDAVQFQADFVALTEHTPHA